MQALETYLKAIVMDEDAAWRESEAFKTFIEWPMSVKMVTATPGGSSGAASRTPRTSLLPSLPEKQHSAMPGALPLTPSTRTLGSSATPHPASSSGNRTHSTPQQHSTSNPKQTDAMDQQDEQLSTSSYLAKTEADG